MGNSNLQTFSPLASSLDHDIVTMKMNDLSTGSNTTCIDGNYEA